MNGGDYMDFSGLEQTGKNLEALGIALQRLSEAIEKAFRWLADHCYSIEEFTESVELARRKIEARKRERKRFTEWNRGEDQRRTAAIRQCERVSITPGGRRYFKTQHRARKPP